MKKRYLIKLSQTLVFVICFHINNQINLLHDTDLQGGGFNNFYTPNLSFCVEACRIQKRCKAFTYIQVSNTCLLKKFVTGRIYSPDYISGIK